MTDYRPQDTRVTEFYIRRPVSGPYGQNNGNNQTYVFERLKYRQVEYNTDTPGTATIFFEPVPEREGYTLAGDVNLPEPTIACDIRIVDSHPNEFTQIV